jgi:hypothetical protein
VAHGGDGRGARDEPTQQTGQDESALCAQRTQGHISKRIQYHDDHRETPDQLGIHDAVRVDGPIRQQRHDDERRRRKQDRIQSFLSGELPKNEVMQP